MKQSLNKMAAMLVPGGPQKKIVSCVEEHLSHWAPQFLEPASARPVALP